VATKLTIDVIDGADFQEEYAGRLINSRGSKLCYVDGIGGDSDPEMTAMALIQARFAAFVTPYSPKRPWCVPIGYKGEGVAEDSNAFRVRVLFGTPSFGRKRVQGIPWYVENDSTFDVVSSQVDPSDGTPITISWESDKDEKLKAEDIATYSYPQSIRRISISGILRFDELVKVRKAVARKVNGQPWSGLGVGYWRCVRVADRIILGQQLTQARIDIDTREDEDWSTYCILKDQRDGKYKANPEAAKRLRKAAYDYGVNNPAKGGVCKIGPYKTANFASALGVSDIDQLNSISDFIKQALQPGAGQ